MEPETKRQKTHEGSDDESEAESPEVVVFKHPGLKPDVRLKVLNVKEFHVHSVFLKLHSAFFRKFLDSPDKKPASASAEFRYEWVTVLDDDGDWILVAADGSKEQDQQEISFKYDDDVEYEAVLFQKLLCAIHGKAWCLKPYNGLVSLERLTQMADYYCALPVVSRSLEIALHQEDDISRFEVKDTLCIAKKLRHKGLFKQGIIKILSPWHLSDAESRASAYRNMTAEDPQIEAVINKARKNIKFMIDDIQHMIANGITVEDGPEPFGLRSQAFERMEKIILGEAAQGPSSTFVDDQAQSTQPYISLPIYYRKLYKLDWKKYAPQFGAEPEIRYIFEDKQRVLLANDLPFEKGAVSGVGKYKNDFLCFPLSDRDLPWEVDEEDW